MRISRYCFANFVADFRTIFVRELRECRENFLVSRTGREVFKKVLVGKDQEKAQSEKDSHSKNRGGKNPN